MKRLLSIIAISCIAASCSGKLSLPEDPEVVQNGRYEFTAQVASLSDPIIWTEGKAVGVYGAVSGINAKYVPYNEFYGKLVKDMSIFEKAHDRFNNMLSGKVL